MATIFINMTLEIEVANEVLDELEKNSQVWEWADSHYVLKPCDTEDIISYDVILDNVEWF